MKDKIILHDGSTVHFEIKENQKGIFKVDKEEIIKEFSLTVFIIKVEYFQIHNVPNIFYLFKEPIKETWNNYFENDVGSIKLIEEIKNKIDNYLNNK